MSFSLSYTPQSMIRGTTDRIQVYFKTDVEVEDLGTPSIAISQNLILIEPETFIAQDDVGPFVYCDLTEAESLSLVAGTFAQVQVTWSKDAQVIKGRAHKLKIEPSLIEEVEG